MNDKTSNSKPQTGSIVGSAANPMGNSRTGAKAEPTRNARAAASPQQPVPQQGVPQQGARGAGGPNAAPVQSRSTGQPSPAAQPRLPPQPEAAALSPSRSSAAAGAAAYSRPAMAAEQRGNGQPTIKTAALNPASTNKTERSKSDKYTELEAAHAAPQKSGRDKFIPAAILLVAGAIGFGAYAQGGVAAGMAAIIAVAAFVLFFGLHLVRRRLGDAARLRNQVTELQQQLQQLQGAPTAQANNNARRSARINTADLEAAVKGTLPKTAQGHHKGHSPGGIPGQSKGQSLPMPPAVPHGAHRSDTQYRSETANPVTANPGVLRTASAAAATGEIVGSVVGGRAAAQAQYERRPVLNPPAPTGTPVATGTPAPTGTPVATGTPAATAAPASARASSVATSGYKPTSTQQNDDAGTRQEKAPPLPPGVRSRSKLSAQPMGPDGQPIVTSVTPVPPPKHLRAEADKGAPAAQSLQPAGQAVPHAADNGISREQTTEQERGQEREQEGGQDGAQAKPAQAHPAGSTAAMAHKPTSPMSTSVRAETPLEAVSELMRAPRIAASSTASPSSTGAAIGTDRTGQASFEVAQKSTQIAKSASQSAARSHDGVAQKLPPIPSAEALPAAIPGDAASGLLASDGVTPSVDALRSAVDEMQASEKRNGKQGNKGGKSGRVVIAATDENSWDGIGEATSQAQFSDAIIEAVASERIEIFVEPILGLDDKKARHFELTAQLKLLTGASVQRSEYDEVLGGANLRPVLDVAKLANSAQLAGRLHRSGKKASVFSDYSGEALASDLFLDQLAELLNSRDNLSGYLVLSLALADVRGFGELHWDTLETLQELGFRFALEHVTDLDVDFDELKNKGFDFVKLDADVFLHGMPLDDLVVPAADLCRHLAEVGQTLIISAIEDETKLAKVLGFGVLLGQGSMFGKPRAVNLDVAATKKSNAA